MLIMMKYKQNEACNREQAKQRPDPIRKLPSDRAPVFGCPPPHLPPIPSTIHHRIKDSTPTPTPISQIQSKKTPPPKIKFWNWPTSQIQSITPNKTRRGLCLSLSPYQNFSTSGSHPDKHTIKDWREWKTLGKPCVFAWEVGDENESSREWRWICKCVCVSAWKKQRNWIFNLI